MFQTPGWPIDLVLGVFARETERGACVRRSSFWVAFGGGPTVGVGHGGEGREGGRGGKITIALLSRNQRSLNVGGMQKVKV